MSNTMISIQASIPGEAEPEGLFIKISNNSWLSPPGGWMTHQSGKWEQLSVVGLSLQSKTGGPNIFMAGLVFVTAKPGDSGQLRDQVSGKVGTWQVVGTSR